MRAWKRIRVEGASCEEISRVVRCMRGMSRESRMRDSWVVIVAGGLCMFVVVVLAILEGVVRQDSRRRRSLGLTSTLESAQMVIYFVCNDYAPMTLSPSYLNVSEKCPRASISTLLILPYPEYDAVKTNICAQEALFRPLTSFYYQVSTSA